MTDRSAQHGTFVVERTYPTATPARTFAAWTDAKAKAVWMDDPDFQSSDAAPAATLDFRIGGHEAFGGLDPAGTSYRYDAVYYDIVPDQRIVYCYEMYTGDERMSVSVTTVEFAPDRDGTRLTYTEQGVFLDGLDKIEARQEGMEFLLTSLGSYLDAQARR